MRLGEGYPWSKTLNPGYANHRGCLVVSAARLSFFSGQVCHGPWHPPRAVHGVVWHGTAKHSFAFLFFFYERKNYLKMKMKAIKGLGLPPKKHSFKVKSLFRVGIGEDIGVVFIANHENLIFQQKVPRQTLRLEVRLHHQMKP